MHLVSNYIQRQKAQFFLSAIPKEAMVLEIGSGGGWLGRHMRESGWINYHGLDITPPADIVGSISAWRSLGIAPESFDVVIAFEVVEHVDCFQEAYDILRPGGLLMVTTNVPHLDWICRILEILGISQRRTSPHDHLVYLDRVRRFEMSRKRTVAFLSQWAILRKPKPHR